MPKEVKKIGEYTILEKLGTGGFGDVWKAEKRSKLSTSLFAIKLFRPKDTEDVQIEKVKKEIVVSQKLSGLPYIVSIIEADQFEDYFYIVSEFADGGSLEEWLKKQPDKKANSIEEAVKIATEILKGLGRMHQLDVIHRDLKPANILIKKGHFCLADFGVSREMKSHSKATGTAGTLEYMPPEAFEKEPSISAETDIWSVGVILQELLTGKLPFPQDEIPSLMAAIIMDEPEPISAEIPLGLREIVKKALQRERKTRFSSAQEMIDALNNPPKFIDELNKQETKKPTIVDEDFEEFIKEDLDKTEILEIEPIQNKKVIESDKKHERDVGQHNKDKPRKVIDSSIEVLTYTSDKKIWNVSDYILWVGGGVFALPLILFILYALIIAPPVEPVSNVNTSQNVELENVSMNSNMEDENSLEKTNIECVAEDYDCEIKKYSKEIESNPSDGYAYNNRGVAYLQNGNINQALGDFRKAGELEVSSGYINRGAYFQKKRETDKALSDFTKAIALDPNDEVAYSWRGKTYFEIGDYKNAILDYKKALEINPNDEFNKERLASLEIKDAADGVKDAVKTRGDRMKDAVKQADGAKDAVKTRGDRMKDAVKQADGAKDAVKQ